MYLSKEREVINMTDIELVIKMPEREYKKIMLVAKMGLGTTIDEIVAKGAVLPKGHGRLIDADDVTDFEGHYITTDAPTIIEADKAER